MSFNVYPNSLDELDAKTEVVDHVVGLLSGIAAGAGVHVKVSIEPCTAGLLHIRPHGTVNGAVRA
jgi:hypothetical protein